MGAVTFAELECKILSVIAEKHFESVQSNALHFTHENQSG